MNSVSNFATAAPVSFIMPTLNEEAYIEKAVASVVAQNYPAEFEIVLVLGPSTDKTNKIAEKLASVDGRITLAYCPLASIPESLNIGIEKAKHEIIVRVDAHSELSAGYAKTATEQLLATGASNIGGIMYAVGSTPLQQAIADCYNSKFGLGGGIYHGLADAGPAESAYLGVFRKEAVKQVGGFERNILRGEDWLLNLKLRNNKKIVWFSPDLQVTYRPRKTLQDLSQQFYATGFWRARLVKRYPAQHPLRYFVPGLLTSTLVLCLLLLISCAVLTMISNTNDLLPIAALALVPIISYALALVVANILMPKRSISIFYKRYWALLTMHLSWGSGFIHGLFSRKKAVQDRSRV